MFVFGEEVGVGGVSEAVSLGESVGDLLEVVGESAVGLLVKKPTTQCSSAARNFSTSAAVRSSRDACPDLLFMYLTMPSASRGPL